MDKSMITIELPQALDINEALQFRDVFQAALASFIASHKGISSPYGTWFVKLATKLREANYDHRLERLEK